MNGKIVLILLACVFVLGCQEKRDFTLNPDGSGRVIFEARMGEKSGATPHGRLKWINDFACRAAEHLDAWADARIVERNGRTFFRGTGLFPDINKGEIKTNVGSILRPTWTVEGDGTAVLTLTKVTKRHPPAVKTPAPLTEEQIAEKVKALRDRPVVPPFMTEKKYAQMRLEYTFDLPGEVVEQTNFTAGEGGALTLTVTGAKLLESARAVKADDALLRELVLADEERGGPKTDARTRRNLFGSVTDISATVKLTGKPQFDYAAEVAAARKKHLAMMTELGLYWTSIPKDMPLRFASMTHRGIENKQIRVEVEPPRPFADADGGIIFAMTAADGTRLLPSIGRSQIIGVPPSSDRRQSIHLWIPLPANLPAGTRTLREILGAVFFTAADVKTVDLGFTELLTGAKGTALNAKIISVDMITDKNGEEQTKIVVAAKAPKNERIDKINYAWPDGVKTLRLVSGMPAFLAGTDEGYFGREFVFRGVLTTPPSFTATVWENAKHFTVPFRMTDVAVTNKAPKETARD